MKGSKYFCRPGSHYSLATCMKFAGRARSIVRASCLGLAAYLIVGEPWAKIGLRIVDLGRLVLLWLGIRKPSKKVSAKVWMARRRACQKCQIFNRVEKTCGTRYELWHNPETGRMEHLGCLCRMDYACSVLEKDCFMFDFTRGKDSIWPLALNGSVLVRNSSKTTDSNPS